MVTNKVNLASLQVKRDNLAQEARIIRRKEQKAKKWIARTVVWEEPVGDNFVKSQYQDKWQVRILSDKERQNYKAAKWATIAKIRKQNRNHNEDVRHSLHEHRTKVVRPEARATNLAIAYMKGVPYSVVETPSKNPDKAFQRRPDAKKIWKLVTRYPLRNDESTEEIKYLEDWLKGE